MSAGYENPPCGPVGDGSVKPSTRTCAPAIGDLPRKTFPNANRTFAEFAFHGRTTRGRVTSIRAGSRAVTVERRLGCARCAGVARLVGVNSIVVCAPALWKLRKGGRLLGGGDSSWEPPRANTISPGTTPPFEDVGVPPIVIATYSLPPTL